MNRHKEMRVEVGEGNQAAEVVVHQVGVGVGRSRTTHRALAPPPRAVVLSQYMQAKYQKESRC